MIFIFVVWCLLAARLMDRYALAWNYLYIKDAIKREDCPERPEMLDRIHYRTEEKGN